MWTNDTLHFYAKALTDAYDQNDTIFGVHLIIEHKVGPALVRDSFKLNKVSRDSFWIAIPEYWGKIFQFRYQLVAINTQQLQRKTPFYIYAPTISSIYDTVESNYYKFIFLPNNNPYLYVFGREIYQKSKFNSFQIDLSETAYKSKIFFVKNYTSKSILLFKILFLE